MRKMLDALTNTNALENASLAQVVGPAIQQLVRNNRTHRRLSAAFVAATASSPEHCERMRTFGIEIVGRFGQLLRDRVHEIRHPEPERAIDFVIQMVLSGSAPGSRVWRHASRWQEAVAEGHGGRARADVPRLPRCRRVSFNE